MERTRSGSASDPLKNKMNYELILNIVLALFGIFLLIAPTNGLVTITIIFAIALLAAGVICGAVFIMRKMQGYALLSFAIVSIILGISMLVFRIQFALVLLPIILGIFMVGSAVICVLAAMEYRRSNAFLWWLPLIAALVALIIAILVFFNLNEATRLLARLIGLYFVVYNAIRIGEYFTIRRMLY